MAKSPQAKHVSRKQQNRVLREQRQRRWITIVTVTIAILVILVLGYGALDTLVLQKNKPVASVDGQDISLADFQARVRYDRYQLIQNTLTLQQYAQMFSFDANSASYFTQQIQTNVSLLQNPEVLGDQVVEELINDVVIAKQAEQMGIKVSDAEVDVALQEAFGYFADGTPTPEPTSIPFATATLSAQQKTLVPPTATLAPTATETVDPTVTAETPAVTPTEEVEVTPTEEPTPYPTATPYTEEGYNQTFADYVASLETDAEFTQEQFREIFRARLLYDKVLEEVTKDVTSTQDYIWARHILVASKEEAAIIMGKLDAGQDWSELAAEFSIDESNKNQGGDLGWFDPSTMVEEFSNAAFALTEVGEISQPIETSFGWHIIQLLGKEQRPATSDQLDQIKQTKFSEWLTSVKAEMEIEKFDNWVGKVPTIPVTPSSFLTQ